MKNLNAQNKINAGLTALLLDAPFFGSLAMRLEYIEDQSIETETTNGKNLRYNPEFIQSIPFEQVKAEICHEVMHCAKLHPYRRDGRDPELWNTACDYAINSELKAAGYKLDDTWLLDAQYDGMSEEQIYAKLEQQSKDKQQQQKDKAKNHGQVDDGDGAQSTESNTEQQQNWKQAVLQAAQQAKQAGNLPSFAQHLVDEIKNPAIDWRAATRKFLEQTAKNDFTFTRPSRRYLQQGLYLPSIKSEQLPPLVFLWDTSGSRWTNEQQTFAANELTAIIQDARPEKTYVIYCDTEISVDVFDRGDPIKLNPRGGGGTDFRPVFEYIENEHINPCCLIGVTDLEALFPESAPSFPVLWCCDQRDASAPFGEVLEVRL